MTETGMLTTGSVYVWVFVEHKPGPLMYWTNLGDRSCLCSLFMSTVTSL